MSAPVQPPISLQMEIPLEMQVACAAPLLTARQVEINELHGTYRYQFQSALLHLGRQFARGIRLVMLANKLLAVTYQGPSKILSPSGFVPVGSIDMGAIALAKDVRVGEVTVVVNPPVKRGYYSETVLVTQRSLEVWVNCLDVTQMAVDPDRTDKAYRFDIEATSCPPPKCVHDRALLRSLSCLGNQFNTVLVHNAIEPETWEPELWAKKLLSRCFIIKENQEQLYLFDQARVLWNLHEEEPFLYSDLFQILTNIRRDRITSYPVQTGSVNQYVEALQQHRTLFESLWFIVLLNAMELRAFQWSCADIYVGEGSCAERGCLCDLLKEFGIDLLANPTALKYTELPSRLQRSLLYHLTLAHYSSLVYSISDLRTYVRKLQELRELIAADQEDLGEGETIVADIEFDIVAAKDFLVEELEKARIGQSVEGDEAMKDDESMEDDDATGEEVGLEYDDYELGDEAHLDLREGQSLPSRRIFVLACLTRIPRSDESLCDVLNYRRASQATNSKMTEDVFCRGFHAYSD